MDGEAGSEAREECLAGRTQAASSATMPPGVTWTGHRTGAWISTRTQAEGTVSREATLYSVWVFGYFSLQSLCTVYLAEYAK